MLSIVVSYLSPAVCTMIYIYSIRGIYAIMSYMYFVRSGAMFDRMKVLSYSFLCNYAKFNARFFLFFRSLSS